MRNTITFKTHNFPHGNITVATDNEYTPDPKSEWKEDEIFIFGSNVQGAHGGGAAKFAHQVLGAEWGVGEGMTGQCYAIPTLKFSGEIKDINGRTSLVSYDELDVSMALLFKTINEYVCNKFYLSKIGLGIAGWKLEDIKGLFWKHYGGEENLVYPIEFEFTDEELSNW